MEDVLVDDDRPVVDVPANPELVSEVCACDVLAVETEPRDLRRDDGTRRQNGHDLIAHGGTAGLAEYSPNGCEGAGVEAELYDIDDMLRVDFGHVGFDAVSGCAGVDGVEFAVGIDEEDVVVVFGKLSDLSRRLNQEGTALGWQRLRSKGNFRVHSKRLKELQH